MNTHYFIGIKVPKPISSAIINARGKTNLHQTHKTLPVVDDLHITLLYLGHVEKNLIDQISQSFEENDWDSFDLSTNELSHFGNDLTPRVVYVSLEESEKLKQLQKKVMEVISDYLDVNQSKEFNAHITIAKKWASNCPISIEQFLLPKQTFEVNHFSIFQINPNRTPRYKEINSITTRRVN
jgi:2'-5' RNA ligase